MVNHNRTAAWQTYFTLVGGFDLFFNPKTGKHRLIVSVFAQFIRLLRHHRFNKIRRFIIGVFIVDPNFRDIITQVVAYGTGDYARFLVQQAR